MVVLRDLKNILKTEQIYDVSVTFDQNGRKCRFGNFELLAANLPN